MAHLAILPKRVDVLDVNDSSSQFRINIDVLNEAFGVGRAMFAKACYPDAADTFIAGNNPGDRFIIWMPKLYSNSSEWKNTISSDGVTIYEDAETTRHEDWIQAGESDLSVLRLVFVKPERNMPYKFVGVFRSGKMNHLHHTYERIASRVKIIGNPVERVALLDDVRNIE